jgi:probable F420-dependent oxidoreductase
MRPFRFALGGDAPTAEGWRELARRTEDLGYDTLFIADHYHLPAGGTGYPVQHLAPIAGLMAAAAWTTSLRVGTRVFCIDYHVPMALAKEAATVDLLSDGRLLLGLGCGWHEAEYTAMGLTFGAPRDRVQKLEETVALMKAHFSGEPIEFDGEVLHVHDYVGAPLPVQRPHPELMIGGSKKRLLSLAGREADTVSLSNVVSAGVDTRHEIGRQMGDVRAAAGDRAGALDVELMAVYVEITDDREATLARAAGAFGIPIDEVRDHPLVLAGTVDHVVEQLQEQRESLGVNLRTVPHHFLEAFAPVVARLQGT